MVFKSKKCISGKKEIAAYDRRNETVRTEESKKNDITREADNQLKKIEANKKKWIEGSRVQSITLEVFHQQLERHQDKFHENLSNAHEAKKLLESLKQYLTEEDFKNLEFRVMKQISSNKFHQENLQELSEYEKELKNSYFGIINNI